MSCSASLLTAPPPRAVANSDRCYQRATATVLGGIICDYAVAA